MEQVQTIISKYWLIALGYTISYLFGIFTIYFKEKAKNKALLSDIEKLTESTEKVKHEYALDIEKRKYKYESKQSQYIKYFNLIDNFSTESNTKTIEVFLPILNKFNKEYMLADGDKELEVKVITEFQNSIQDYLFKSNESLLRIKQETNSIRLISGDKVRSYLDELENLYDIALEKSNAMISNLLPAMIANDFSEITNSQEELISLGSQLIVSKNQLMDEIRKELNEI